MANEFTTNREHLEREFDAYCQHALAKGLITQAELEQFVLPYKDIPKHKLALFAHMQTALRRPYPDPLYFSVKDIPPSKWWVALQWTVLHVSLLNLPGLEVATIYQRVVSKNPGPEEFLPLIKPFGQCYWCGSSLPIKENHQKIPVRYCHSLDCKDRANSNPGNHTGCCLGEWGLIRRAFQQRLFDYRGKILEENHFQKKVKDSFLNFLNECYEKNLAKEQFILNKKPLANEH